MTDMYDCANNVLAEAGFAVHRSSYLSFEDATSIGFLFIYQDADSLVEGWARDVDQAVSNHRFQLRKAGKKAWNVYAVFLAIDSAEFPVTVSLSAIEEDLSGTRKIVRSGVSSLEEMRAALLPLVPIQSAPQLEAIDLADEIRQRTTELPRRVVDAFLSGVDEAVVIQVLEEEQ